MIFQCVPNFSEGRRTEVVEEIASAMRESARLIDYSADWDHNRCVMTLLGDAAEVRRAVLAGARVAVQRIDLRTHQGIHPRAGAIDVLPVVPLGDTPREAATALAAEIGADLAREHGLPVYFYEDNSADNSTVDVVDSGEQHKRLLPDLRRGGFEAFSSAPLVGERAPDLGPAQVHPSAGVVIVGARAPLVAYNINFPVDFVVSGSALHVTGLTVAQQVARRIRQERLRLAALEGVRALGLFLASRNQAQISLNLTCPSATPLPTVFGLVFAFVQAELARHGISDIPEIELESEIIGAIPRTSLGGLPASAIHWHTYRPTQILEYWLEAASLPLLG